MMFKADIFVNCIRVFGNGWMISEGFRMDGYTIYDTMCYEIVTAFFNRPFNLGILREKCDRAITGPQWALRA